VKNRPDSRTCRSGALWVLSFLAFYASPVLSGVRHSGDVLWSEVSSIRLSAITPEEKSLALKRLYKRSLAEWIASLELQQEADLRMLFRMLKTSSFFAQAGDYDARSLYLHGMRDVLKELRRRNIAAESEVQAYYEALITARDFVASAELRQAYPKDDFYDYRHFEVTTAPGPGHPMGYVEHDGGLSLVEPTTPARGTYVVVVIGCHFAEDAASKVLRDAELAGMFNKSNVTWLISGAELDREVLTEWNRRFPMFPAMIAFDNAAWKGVDFTASPTFNVFRDGKVVESILGLDSTENVERLRRILASHDEEAEK